MKRVPVAVRSEEGQGNISATEQSNFGIAGMLTEAILLGNVAILAGKKIEFDAKKVEVTNDKDANKLLKPEYRKGWELVDRA